MVLKGNPSNIFFHKVNLKWNNMDYFKPIFIQVKFNVADGLPRRLTTQNQVIFPLILPFCNKIVKSVLKR